MRPVRCSTFLAAAAAFAALSAAQFQYPGQQQQPFVPGMRWPGIGALAVPLVGIGSSAVRRMQIAPH